MAKLKRYIPEIKAGYPPERADRIYDARIEDGSLLDAVDKIPPGHFIGDLSRGSAGKFAKRLRLRHGMEAVRVGIGKDREDVYAVTTEWLKDHPRVGYGSANS
jgi:hypothetical protein